MSALIFTLHATITPASNQGAPSLGQKWVFKNRTQSGRVTGSQTVFPSRLVALNIPQRFQNCESQTCKKISSSSRHHFTICSSFKTSERFSERCRDCAPIILVNVFRVTLEQFAERFNSSRGIVISLYMRKIFRDVVEIVMMAMLPFC